MNLPHVGARMIWVRLVILAAIIAPVAYWTQSVVDIAICRCLAEILFLPGLFHAVHRIVGISFKQYFDTLYRPLLASAIMAVVVIAANVLMPLSGNYRLMADIVLGAAAFLGSAWLLWHAAGRPCTPESDVFDRLAKILRPSLAI
jgi:uncharacterized membrane protein YqaE (UPF0057 family)